MKISEFEQNLGPGGYERAYMDHEKGGFNFSSDSRNEKEIHGTVLGVIKQRRLWVEKTNGKSVGCKSPDAEMGFPTRAFPFVSYESDTDIDVRKFQPLCNGCPFSHWDSDPKCQEKWYVVVVRDLTNPRVLIVEMTQSGIPVMRDFLKDIVARGENLFDVRVEFSTSTVITPRAEFQRPRIEHTHQCQTIGIHDQISKLYAEVKTDLREDATVGSIYTSNVTSNKFATVRMGS